MEDAIYEQFFIQPCDTFHRRYEALRAYFVERRPVAEIAERYGYKPDALNVMISRFRSQFRSGRLPPFSFVTAVGGQSNSHDAQTSMVQRRPQSPISDS